MPTAGAFVADRWIRLLSISALILIPCVWHRHIEAGDLGSHIYNAWLAQLIEHGQAPGLRIAYPSTNILFDSLLSGLAKIFGLHAAEILSVAIAVLIFFWGAFALVAAASKRAPWLLTPLIAMVAYGWTFEMGFFNYYIALGLSFFALAILWRGTLRECAVAIVLIPLDLRGASARRHLAHRSRGLHSCCILYSAASSAAAGSRRGRYVVSAASISLAPFRRWSSI